MSQERLVIAVPNGFRDITRGPSRHSDESRLAAPTRRLIEQGCRLPYQASHVDAYFGFAEGFPVEYVEMRGQDIPGAVADRNSGIHLGVTGKDRYDNSPDELFDYVGIIRPLPYGRCELQLGVPDDEPNFSEKTTLEDVVNLRITMGEDVASLRIATGLERTVNRILTARMIPATIIPLNGHIEIVTRYNLADVLIDITETGGTMRRHGITPAERLRSYYAVLLSKKGELDKGVEAVRSWFLDRVDVALANPNTWMTPKEIQSLRNGMQKGPVLPGFNELMPEIQSLAVAS